MAFIQVVIEEDCSAASGAALRNRANFAALSTLCGVGEPGHVVALRTEMKVRRATVPTVLPLARQDVSRFIETCRKTAPAFVLIEGVQLLEAAEAIHAALPNLPIVIDMHNVESSLRDEIDLQRVPSFVRPLAPVFLARRRRRCREVERIAATIARQIWLCSEQDRDRLRSIVGATETAVVANPIPQWAEQASPNLDRAGTNDVLFVGHLAYPPNVAAVRLLVSEIMPRLRRLVPDARLHVCGRRPRRRVAAALHAHGHLLTADPHDLAEIYRTAAVTAMPLGTGGGTRLKVLEAMAVGCPIVATPKAVEGLQLVSGVHYLEAGTADEFSGQLARFLTSSSRRSATVARSRELVLDRFGKATRTASIGQALAAAGL